MSQWIERAIARYFAEEDLKYDGLFREVSEKERTKTSAILRPQFWKGQQHGGRSASVHARHLRPLCETVSSDPTHVEAAPRNMVLFMPYLLWETDRQREKLSQALDLESERHHDAKQTKEGLQKKQRQEDRGDLTIPCLAKKGKDVTWPKDVRRSQSPARRASTALWLRWLHHRKEDAEESSPFKKKNGRIIAGEEIGQVLFDAAVLYEAMANYRDRRFIQKYLHEDPPLHPRRTLDQAYYWTLKTTKLRDRDQVVYRGTTVDQNLRHRLRPKKQPKSTGWVVKALNHKKRDKIEFGWDCEERNNATKPTFSQEHPKDRDEPTTRSLEETVGIRCTHCRDHIRKVSRVVMVDQLWMWILDEQTIITCFPKRYGVNKQDSSGVHKSIRARLKALRKDHIRTVFDLALIILDECSNTFFDRTKTQDRQPQVMDIFSESIGNVNNKQTISFEHLWEWTGKLGNFAKPGYLPANLSDFVIPLLNINKEGQLQREIKDIIDELDIMIYISSQQRDVIKKFKKEVTHILDPSGTWKDKPPTSPISDFTEGNDKKRYDYFWFVKTADELLGDVDDQIGELEGLRKSAESTSTSLDHLLNLKQQQASVFQTWQSTKQAEETMRQGEAIIIFTVMTIIFLPLGFIASIFGMNNKQISGDEMPMTLRSQFNYMFPISTGIICFALVIAFSDYVRTVIWLIYKYLITLTVIKSGLYDKVYLSLDWKGKDLVRNIEDRVAQMKADVKQARQKRVSRHNRYSSSPADKGSLGSIARDGSSGCEATSGPNHDTASAADSSASSGSRFRPRSLRLGVRREGDEDRPHVIHMGAPSPANPNSSASTVPPTPARNPVVHATSAPGQLEP
ncbi:hypothetical protein FJTKL_09172 [Diaporthe vaccinii]|uniref:Ankyrin repeat protein n=1 Tax=Diaporthe vaccinii TaxID=105482 RepID=A0ABR4EP37_9PEZI